MVFWGCLVLFVCCMMAGICIWEMFNQLALLAVWKFAKSAECGMSAILKVPILGMIVNKSRGKKDKKAVKKWREDHMAKEWKCASMLQCLPVMCVLVCCCPCRHVAVQCLLVQINNFCWTARYLHGLPWLLYLLLGHGPLWRKEMGVLVGAFQGSHQDGHRRRGLCP